jgi:hypothetical protein
MMLSWLGFAANAAHRGPCSQSATGDIEIRPYKLPATIAQ